MPDTLKASDVESKTDPTVSNQWDDQTPKKQQIDDFYKTVDGMKIGLLSTIRDGIGPVARSMAVAKREGPDFLFLANQHSNKFKDLANDKTAHLTFQNSSSQDWVSVTGTVATTSNSDPRIKDLYSKGTSAWFGDLGDGVHNGTADDPRMAIIELKAKYISYWKATVGTLGFVKEVAQASFTGQVANTGVQRQLVEEDIEAMRMTPS
ncbi:MAG: hypothetical protein ALECFALPRED_009995 [Alectoria fallacina]|uniref:General stress protein FMN-binding split barrel domain-containing protein n=1 Tax=Alectoria fallacina TaxID=1903189 RepID=A0A8H3J961_9LECA|nr:MAG: hypothetical protein ALECFALPRED_009995 [Alectoria fallacina]